MVFAALEERPPSDEAFRRFTDLLLQSADTGGADDQPAALARVRARATMVERAQRALEASMVEALDAGHSLRQVGTAAGLSHERVRQVVRDARER
jgi:DNA-directed RNA polymerase sigma subunit (sigma70/sigma32)